MERLAVLPDGCPGGWDFLEQDGNTWFCETGGQYKPSSYTYTDANGTTYTISASGQLQSITDLHNNGLTITASGITSTNGLNVAFTRDANNRITQITDPQGNIYSYAYDVSGNLASVTYPANNTSNPVCSGNNVPNTSTYTYNSSHLYTGGIDALCHLLPTSAYYGTTDTDPNGNSLNGRLKSVQDALGETTNYAYNLATNTTTVTYPDTGVAAMSYDNSGNLLTLTDPLGHTTTNVYDANHNLTSVTDPLSHTTSSTYDKNGNKTSLTYPATATSKNTTSSTAYNQYSEPTSTTDELGNVKTINYDANYTPQKVTDNLNGVPTVVASYLFNSNGTIAAGAIGYDIATQPTMASQFGYDSDGNLNSSTDALGRTTTFTYNSLGQKTSMTVPAPNSGANTAVASGIQQHAARSHLSADTAVSNSSGTTTIEYYYDALGNLHIWAYGSASGQSAVHVAE